MNKTVSINLGGFFFHIDEDAYQKLNRYLDAIRRSLSPDGKDEIMADIEGRIAELLSEKMKNDKQVVSNNEVDDIIATMGQPEDYRIDEDTEPKTGSSNTYSSTYNATYYAAKKLYRDGDKNIIAGVCAGLGHYFRIDPLWIRILFIISPFVTFGTSLIIYVLLWILLPKAITTTEKLEMKGEPINISNIEKKVKEEFDILQEKFKSVDYDKLGNQVKSGAEKLGTGVSNVVLGILKAVAKVLGALITVFSALSLGGLIVFFILMMFSSTLVCPSWWPYVEAYNFTDAPMWLLALIAFFAVAIPLFALFISGLRILVDNMKPVSNVVTYILLTLWIITVSACIYLGLYQVAQIGNEGKTFVKQEFSLAKTDTLQLVFKNNEYFTKYNDYDRDFDFKQDSLGNEVLYSNNVRLYVRHTDAARPYIQVEKIANGNTMTQARKTSETIKYNFKIKGNTLILDNYLLTGINAKFRGQRVEIFLYLPEGIYFKPDINVQKYDATDDEFFNLWFDNANHVYQMKKDIVECLDCVADDQPSKDLIEKEDNINREIERAGQMQDSQDKTIRIMELEAERAKLEIERSKMEHEFYREVNNDNQ